jgi:hypothetical protein
MEMNLREGCADGSEPALKPPFSRSSSIDGRAARAAQIFGIYNVATGLQDLRKVVKPR